MVLIIVCVVILPSFFQIWVAQLIIFALCFDFFSVVLVVLSLIRLPCFFVSGVVIRIIFHI